MDGTLTTHTLDAGLGLPEVLVEHDGDDTTRYLHLPNGVATDDGTGWSYSAPDGLGSVRQRVDGSGQVVSVDGYRPFGSPLAGDGGAPYGYTGEWSIVPEAKRSGREDEAGLLFLRARYYAPGSGRFVSRDTWPGDVWQPASRQGYSYAANNPLLYVDPSGHIPTPPDHNPIIDYRSGMLQADPVFEFYLRGRWYEGWSFYEFKAAYQAGLAAAAGETPIAQSQAIAAEMARSLVGKSEGAEWAMIYLVAFSQLENETWLAAWASANNQCTAYALAVMTLFAPDLDQYWRMSRRYWPPDSYRAWNDNRDRLLSNAEVRQWYNEQVGNINTNGPSTREFAEQVHAQRNALKAKARALMIDREEAVRLNRDFPLRDFEYYVQKYSAQGYSGEALWARIIQGSATPNPAVNARFGIR